MADERKPTPRAFRRELVLLVQPGDRFVDDVGPLRVMAVAEGYAMLRRPYAVPFVRPIPYLLCDCRRA
jgi:hypothetical protein